MTTICGPIIKTLLAATKTLPIKTEATLDSVDLVCLLDNIPEDNESDITKSIQGCVERFGDRKGPKQTISSLKLSQVFTF
jgi:hypothetical protein